MGRTKQSGSKVEKSSAPMTPKAINNAAWEVYKAEQKATDKSLSMKDIVETWGTVSEENKEVYRKKVAEAHTKSVEAPASSSSSSAPAIVEEGDGAEAAPAEGTKEGETAMDVTTAPEETTATDEPAVVSQPEETPVVSSTPAESEPITSAAEETTATPSSPRATKGKGKEAAVKTSPVGKKGRKPKADAKSPEAASPEGEKEGEAASAVMAE